MYGTLPTDVTNRSFVLNSRRTESDGDTGFIRQRNATVFVHLLVVDTKENVISKSLQLIAGRTAQEFNIRKQRKGAFWEDRYHATAVATDEHRVKCLFYIDLNMVRAGVVKHPSEYKVCGLNEIQNPPKRYSVIDREALANYFSVINDECLRQEHLHWVEAELAANKTMRNELWSEAIAVGNEEFVNDIFSSD